MPVRMHLLGPPQFERDAQAVELNSAKAVALLALLALSRPAQRRERVMASLWSESAPDAARKNLRNILWTLRKALGDAAIETEADRLALAAGVWVDARVIADLKMNDADLRADTDIANLKATIELYRGPLLEGFALADSPEFEIWLTGERERLSQTYLRALAQLVEAHRARQEWQGVIEAARRALAEDNLQEPMYRALMEAHAHLGERAEAARVFETLNATLERELGVKPLPETEALRDSVVRGESESRAGTGSRPALARSRVPQLRTPFVGRARELARLHAEAASALSGGARVVLLSGEVGIGKTRLWREWLASPAPDQRRVALQAHCLEATGLLPFTPVIEMFSAPAVTARLFGNHPALPAVWLAEVARIIPDARARVPHLPLPPALPGDEERRRLFEAFAQCLLALHGRPLVVFMDDVHWIDGATLDWLGFAVDRLREYPLMLVLAYRPADAPAALVQRVAQWARAGVLGIVTLEHLTDEESAALVTALGGDAALAARARSQGGGNPYFLIELVQSPSSDIPLALTELLRARVARLSELSRQVLQAAAILDSDFDVSTLSRTSGRSESETVDALDELVDAAELAERDGSYAFAHPLIAAVVRDGLSGARRAFLHRRAAAALESSSQAQAALAGRIGAHYAQGNDSARAAHFFEKAAEYALSVAAPQEAVRFYEQALRNEPTALRRMGLGSALLRLGEVAAAREAFQSAYAELVSGGEEHHAAQASLSVAETFVASERFEEGREWMERSLALSDLDADPASHALAHLLLGSSRLASGKAGADAERHVTEAARIAAERRLPQVEARARFIEGNLHAERGDLSRARTAYDISIASADAANDDYQAILARNNASYHALLDGDLTAAHAHIEAAFARAEANALRLPLQYLYSTRGEIALAEEEFDEAQQWFERALSEAQHNENEAHVANTHMNLGLVARARGDQDEALILLNRARAEAARLPVPHLSAQIDLHLAELYRQRGARVAAEESLRQAEALLANGERKRLTRWAQHLRGQMEKE